MSKRLPGVRELKDAAPARRLKLREVQGNVAYGRPDVYSWYTVAEQTWSFATAGEKLAMVDAGAARYGALAGRWLHIRGTSQPVDAKAWAAGLHARSPNAVTPGWKEYLTAEQEHLFGSRQANKITYLGVRLRKRSTLQRFNERIFEHVDETESESIARDAALVGETVGDTGLKCTPASPEQMEYLIRRSSGLGLPVPLPTNSRAAWADDDVADVTDELWIDAVPLGRCVRVTGVYKDQPVTRYVTVLTIGRMEPIPAVDSGRDPWLADADRLPFTVEWSIRGRVLAGAEAAGHAKKFLLRGRAQQAHYAEHDLDEPVDVQRRIGHIKQMMDEMQTGADASAARFWGWFRVMVSGATEQECLGNARQVRDHYRKRQIAVRHERGQYGLAREFGLCEPLACKAHMRRVPVTYLAAGMLQVSSQVGDGVGPYIGYVARTGKTAVRHDPFYATEDLRRSGLVPVVGTPGAGKSAILGSVVYSSVKRGIPCLMLDPGGTAQRMRELPDIGAVTVTRDLSAGQPGSLNTYRRIPEPNRDHYPDTAEGQAEYDDDVGLAAGSRKELAMDVCNMLLPVALANAGPTDSMILDAVETVGGSVDNDLNEVAACLDGMPDDHAHRLARDLRNISHTNKGRLFFPSPGHLSTVDPPSTLLTILTMSGLMMPDPESDQSRWTMEERLSVPLLHLAAWEAMAFVEKFQPKARKLITLDEVGEMAAWTAGRTLFTRLPRRARKYNNPVYVASQNPGDVFGIGDIANFISSGFVGRIEDEDTAAEALRRILRVKTGVGHEQKLASFPTGPKVPFREFVMRDVHGRVERVRVDNTHRPALMEVLRNDAEQTGLVA